MKNFLTALILVLLVCIISSPARFLQAGLDGLSAWALCVLPSILPFMFFTRVLMSFGSLSALSRPFSSISKTLFHAPPIATPTFLLAILSGYPVGSKMVANLFMQGQITQDEAFRMTSFCSTSGPMFIVGAVGVGMFGSAKIGYILFVSHVLGAIMNGILFRNFGIKHRRKKMNFDCSDEKSGKINQKNREKTEIAKMKQVSLNSAQSPEINQTKNSLADIVQDCAQSVLSVGVIIAIFFVIIECLSPLFSVFPSTLSAFLSGVVEITKGCKELSAISGNLSVILCSFVISFGGISTILQSLTMLKDIKMPIKLFITQKFTHALFSTLLTMLFLAI